MYALARIVKSIQTLEEPCHIVSSLTRLTYLSEKKRQEGENVQNRLRAVRARQRPGRG